MNRLFDRKNQHSKYTHVLHRDIPLDTDYESVVSDFYRSESAKAIQFAFRTYNKVIELYIPLPIYRAKLDIFKSFIKKEHLQFQDKFTITVINNQLYSIRISKLQKIQVSLIHRHPHNEIFYQYLLSFASSKPEGTYSNPTLSQVIRMLVIARNKIIEPENPEQIEQIVTHIKSNQYELIDYHNADFPLYLFAALRKQRITMNEMLTAKLLYESRVFFELDKIKSYHLDNKDGPYKPRDTIRYWTDKEDARLQALIQEHSDITPIYYTMDFSYAMMVTILYCTLTKRVGQFVLFQMREIFIRFIHSKTELEPETKDAWIKHVKEMEYSQSAHQEERLAQFIKGYLNEISPSLDSQEKTNAEFWAEINKFSSNMPMFCCSPNYDPSSSTSPILSFILPTIDTFNLLNEALHGEEASLPIACIGPGQTRHIRAIDELPALSKESYSTTQSTLALLYPSTTKIKKQARIVEVTLPAIPYTEKVHGRRCHPFLLSLHDLFHVWRNSQNFKKLIRKLRQLNDEKSDFSYRFNGMSKVIWPLTDMDFSIGSRQRIHPDALILSKGLFSILEHIGLYEEIYLVFFSILKEPSEWEMLLGVSIDVLLKSDLELFELQQFRAKIETLKALQLYLTQKPDASVIELFLYCVIKDDEAYKDVHEGLIEVILNNQKSIFTWTRNNGIQFTDNAFEKISSLPEINKRVKSNGAKNIARAFFKLIIENDYDVANQALRARIAAYKKLQKPLETFKFNKNEALLNYLIRQSVDPNNYELLLRHCISFLNLDKSYIEKLAKIIRQDPNLIKQIRIDLEYLYNRMHLILEKLTLAAYQSNANMVKEINQKFEKLLTENMSILNIQSLFAYIDLLDDDDLGNKQSSSCLKSLKFELYWLMLVQEIKNNSDTSIRQHTIFQIKGISKDGSVVAIDADTSAPSVKHRIG